MLELFRSYDTYPPTIRVIVVINIMNNIVHCLMLDLVHTCLLFVLMLNTDHTIPLYLAISVIGVVLGTDMYFKTVYRLLPL